MPISQYLLAVGVKDERWSIHNLPKKKSQKSTLTLSLLGIFCSQLTVDIMTLNTVPLSAFIVVQVFVFFFTCNGDVVILSILLLRVSQ